MKINTLGVLFVTRLCWAQQVANVNQKSNKALMQ
jgi:hypothetical protein